MDAVESVRTENGLGRRQAVGCFPLYPPLELFHSMDLRPVVLWPKNGDGDKYQTFSDQHMQRYTCSGARYLLGSILAEMGDRLEAVFMYNACDTLRNLPEIVECGLARQGCSRSVMKMHLPMVSLSRPDAESYLKEEVRSLVQTLEHRFCRGFRISAFQKSVELYRSARRLGLELEERVAEGGMGFAEFARLVMRGHFLSPEEQIPILSERLRKRDGKAGSAGAGCRLMLSGILPPPPPVIEAIEAAGFRIVCNDLAALYRSYAYTPPAGIDRVEDYFLDFYRNHFPCATLLYSSELRGEAMLARAREKGVDAVVFFGEKFCESEALDYPYLRRRLERNGMRTLFLASAADQGQHLENCRTRIDAFAEMMGTPG